MCMENLDGELPPVRPRGVGLQACHARFLAGIRRPGGCRREWRHGKPEARSTEGCRCLGWFFDPPSSPGGGAAYFASAILRPVRALSRAASRISTTITLFSSEFRPAGLKRPRATPEK